MSPVQVQTVIIVVSLVILNTRIVLGHGRLWEPPGRSTLWRRGFKSPVNYQDNQLFCGGFQRQQLNGGRCGICGDPWDGDRENEAGGKFANGIISRTYTEAANITIVVDITANHWGWFEFKLCPVNHKLIRATQDCLEQNPLLLADGSGARWHLPSQEAGQYTMNYKLPDGLKCRQCVLQWHYKTGNSWGADEESEGPCVGCGAQENFRGCADIAIQSAIQPKATDILASTIRTETTFSTVITADVFSGNPPDQTNGLGTNKENSTHSNEEGGEHTYFKSNESEVINASKYEDSTIELESSSKSENIIHHHPHGGQNENEIDLTSTTARSGFLTNLKQITTIRPLTSKASRQQTHKFQKKSDSKYGRRLINNRHRRKKFKNISGKKYTYGRRRAHVYSSRSRRLFKLKHSIRPVVHRSKAGQQRRKINGDKMSVRPNPIVLSVPIINENVKKVGPNMRRKISQIRNQKTQDPDTGERRISETHIVHHAHGIKAPSFVVTKQVMDSNIISLPPSEALSEAQFDVKNKDTKSYKGTTPLISVNKVPAEMFTNKHHTSPDFTLKKNVKLFNGYHEPLTTSVQYPEMLSKQSVYNQHGALLVKSKEDLYLTNDKVGQISSNPHGLIGHRPGDNFYDHKSYWRDQMSKIQMPDKSTEDRYKARPTIVPRTSFNAVSEKDKDSHIHNNDLYHVPNEMKVTKIHLTKNAPHKLHLNPDHSGSIFNTFSNPPLERNRMSSTLRNGLIDKPLLKSSNFKHLLVHRHKLMKAGQYDTALSEGGQRAIKPHIYSNENIGLNLHTTISPVQHKVYGHIEPYKKKYVPGYSIKQHDLYIPDNELVDADTVDSSGSHGLEIPQIIDHHLPDTHNRILTISNKRNDQYAKIFINPGAIHNSYQIPMNTHPFIFNNPPFQNRHLRRHPLTLTHNDSVDTQMKEGEAKYPFPNHLHQNHRKHYAMDRIASQNHFIHHQESNPSIGFNAYLNWLTKLHPHEIDALGQKTMPQLNARSYDENHFYSTGSENRFDDSHPTYIPRSTLTSAIDHLSKSKMLFPYSNPGHSPILQKRLDFPKSKDLWNNHNYLEEGSEVVSPLLKEWGQVYPNFPKPDIPLFGMNIIDGQNQNLEDEISFSSILLKEIYSLPADMKYMFLQLMTIILSLSKTDKQTGTDTIKSDPHATDTNLFPKVVLEKSSQSDHITKPVWGKDDMYRQKSDISDKQIREKSIQPHNLTDIKETQAKREQNFQIFSDFHKHQVESHNILEDLGNDAFSNHRQSGKNIVYLQPLVINAADEDSNHFLYHWSATSSSRNTGIQPTLSKIQAKLLSKLELRPTSQRCRPIGTWATQSDMEEWCNFNCRKIRLLCLPTRCVCNSQASSIDTRS